MILIVVKFRTKPEYTEQWPEIVEEFTRATLAEPGNIFFEWSMSLDTDDEWVLVEAFQDDAAEAHVSSDHFAAGLEAMRPALAETPRIISRAVEGTGWGEMGELKID
ncbi:MULTISPECIES: putative quinol monooxygenase [Janibacter]|uniref:Antibiotic biosynthesis monooxygenase n=1 Tax=Janibacter hoylei PVAS-1 TaxID=1210046 RepID=K1E757_9MICO|nr:putative quinol monooxygenase [Janibacter hoylei]EKA61237.1 antibiotic biosynthesis monooxygenase domain-containing protein [Janibacter hoylei PVAS-1]MCT1619837.1 antibiotic biosynthesis monooxygenase [Janibacter hoylei]MCT2294032.1 antibiotic biosynthesis monooxygenase [Janibacter hoylei]MCW4601915.1 antibiotic biosynthesis monooxygenase [Janibacter hoylei]RWU82819.1 antibiotic biosynthesis monooxygenase [Janibacter hoylei PVAS-1]